MNKAYMQMRKYFVLAAILTICGTARGLAQDVRGEAGRWTFVGHLTNPGDTLWAFATDNLKEQNVLVRDGGTFRFTTELTRQRNTIS